MFCKEAISDQTILFFFITDITGVDELTKCNKIETKHGEGNAKTTKSRPSLPMQLRTVELFCKQYTGAEDNAIQQR